MNLRQCLGNGSCRYWLSEMQCVAEGVLQQGHLLVALAATQPGFDLEQGRCTPAQFLITRAPPRHALCFALELRHHVLDQVRRLETHAERGDDAETMQRQRLVEAFGQAIRRGRVEHKQLLVQSLERMLRFGVRGVRIGRLQFVAPEDLLRLA